LSRAPTDPAVHDPHGPFCAIFLPGGRQVSVAMRPRGSARDRQPLLATTHARERHGNSRTSTPARCPGCGQGTRRPLLQQGRRGGRWSPALRSDSGAALPGLEREYASTWGPAVAGVRHSATGRVGLTRCSRGRRTLRGRAAPRFRVLLFGPRRPPNASSWTTFSGGVMPGPRAQS